LQKAMRLPTYGIAMSQVYKRRGIEVEGFWQKSGHEVYTHYSKGAGVAIGFTMCECGWLLHSKLLHFPR
jgi:hypothetical protein